jgi:hypothetical protein
MLGNAGNQLHRCGCGLDNFLYKCDSNRMQNNVGYFQKCVDFY